MGPGKCDTEGDSRVRLSDCPFAWFLIVEPIMDVADLKTAFDRVVCINLDRQPGRWRRLVGQIGADWPFRPVERVAAVNGQDQTPPKSWDTPSRAAEEEATKRVTVPNNE